MLLSTETQPAANENAVTESSASQPSGTPAGDAVPPALRIRYRIRFAKTGLLRWISHRDLARLWERLLRRAALKLSMTEGFHPKPRVAFPSALALGVQSLDEVVEIELAEELSVADLFQRLRADNQPGLTICSVCRLPQQFGKAQLLRSDFEIIAAEPPDQSALQHAIDALMSSGTVSVERKKKTMTIDVASQIERLVPNAAGIELSLAASDSASLRPGDVLDLLGLSDWVEKGALITRVRVVLQKEFSSEDPAAMVVAAPETTEPFSRPSDDSPQ